MGRVGFYTSPWVSGLRASSYLGPVTVRVFAPGRDSEKWAIGLLEALDSLEERALMVGGNAILSLEIAMDPHGREDGLDGLIIVASGVVANLEALF